VQYGFFAVNGFDMWGGDLERESQYASFEEAVIEVKKRINYDEHRCGMITEKKDGFRFYIKAPSQASPSKDQKHHANYTNIFYGKRFKVSKGTLPKMQRARSGAKDHSLSSTITWWEGSTCMAGTSALK
jgi:hypothetical protein